MTAPERICLLPDDGWSWVKGPKPPYEENAIEYVRADLAAVQPDPNAVAVKVKPLVWEQSGGSHIMDGESHTVPSGYTVRYADENGWKWQASGIGAYGWEPSPALAKAAAQSDHTARILDALEPQPDPRDEVIARLVDALEFYAPRQVDGITFTGNDDAGVRARTAPLAAPE